MLQLDDWQKDVMNYKGDFLLCTGRQVGKTTVMAIKAAEFMISKPGAKIIIASLTEDQAKLIIVMMLDYLEKNHKGLIAKGKDKPTQNKITLKNKASVIARPVGNTGDALRGFTGDVLILDENSRMSEAIMTAAKPTLLTTGGQLWICSTPFGKEGFFYECFENKNGRFKVFHISSEEVIYNRPISETWTEKKRAEAMKFLESEKADMSELEYGQEYLGLFLEELRRFYPEDLIDELTKLKRPDKVPDMKNYLGVDIARMGDDSSSFEVVGEKNNKYEHLESETTQKQLTTQTEMKIIEMANKWKAKKVGIDAGAGTLGVSIFDHLLQTPIKHKVIALNNRSIAMDDEGKKKQRLMKEDMHHNLLSMMQHREIMLLDDDNLRLSLRSFQYEYVKTPMQQSRMRIFAQKNNDIAEGLIRAAWLAKKEKSLNLFATYSGNIRKGIK